MVVFEGGTVVKEGTPAKIFDDVAWLQEKQLDVPIAKQFADKLATKGVTLDAVLDIDALADQLAEQLGGSAHVH